MSLIESFKAKGILQSAGTSGLYGIDFNGKPGIQEEEVIPDTNKNGKADLKEVLEFVVNNVASMPVITTVKEVIEKNNDEDKDIQEFIKDSYIPRLDKRMQVLKEAQEVVLKEKFNLYKEKYIELEQAIKDIDTEKVSELKKMISTMEKEGILGKALYMGVQPIIELGIIVLPDGQKVPVEKSTSSDKDDISYDRLIKEAQQKGKNIYIPGTYEWISYKVFFARPTTVTLPGGTKCSTQCIVFNKGTKNTFVNEFVDIRNSEELTLTINKVSFSIPKNGQICISDRIEMLQAPNYETSHAGWREPGNPRINITFPNGKKFKCNDARIYSDGIYTQQPPKGQEFIYKNEKMKTIGRKNCREYPFMEYMSFDFYGNVQKYEPCEYI